MSQSKDAKSERTAYLEKVNASVREQFIARNNILSFDRFFELFLQNPVRFSRSAYQYLADMIDHFGRRPTKDVAGVAGFAVFDQEFVAGNGRVWGQAEVEREIYRILKGFARGGRADKLILMHGPNGSAKSSLVRCLHQGLEEYSKRDEGALYRFSWVFPEEKFTREKIGFSKDDTVSLKDVDSYAYLPEERIAARLSCPLNDSPIFLIPREKREELFAELRQSRPDFAAHQLSKAIEDGDLSQKNRMIYDALLTAYNGDYAAVLRHVQVERYYILHRYRVGAVTIEPQLSVDASVHQITADRSLSSLPAILQNLSIFEPFGHLVQANHGIVEYSDLLKRPLEAYKYLLSTCETGTINIENTKLYLDLVMIGSSNDKYVEGFKQTPDFTSFKGRLELVRVPYLRNYLAEKNIYDAQINLDVSDRKVAPHLTECVALWAVLTRLRRPDPENYPEEIQPVAGRMNPLEKALFYAAGDTPEWATITQAKELRASRQAMLSEFNAGPAYEGAFGASPREGKLILQATLQREGGTCITPRRAFAEIRRLIGDPSVFEWLQIEPDGDYFNQKRLVEYVEDFYIRRVDNELKVAMEMIEETQYAGLLERYVALASAWIHKKRITDPMSGQEREVNLNELTEIEKIIAPDEDPKLFRQDVVSRVGAWALDNRGERTPYAKVFQNQIKRLEVHYFSRQQSRIRKLNENMLRFLSDRKKEVAEEDAAEVQGCLERMEKRFGYPPECTREVVAMLMQTKYKEREN
ncbi:MAG: serine protein kinase PrkA [Myxococcales bacterium]|nr:MAG: serine protein kinase PrkA [Myxococcales bacterium]